MRREKERKLEIGLSGIYLYARTHTHTITSSGPPPPPGVGGGLRAPLISLHACTPKLRPVRSPPHIWRAIASRGVHGDGGVFPLDSHRPRRGERARARRSGVRRRQRPPALGCRPEKSGQKCTATTTRTTVRAVFSIRAQSTGHDP